MEYSPIKKKITFLCSRLDMPGGIEKVVVSHANLFFKKGHSVTICILDQAKGSFYPIEEGVKIIHLPVNFGITQKGTIFSRKLHLIKDILSLRKTLKILLPQIIISSEYVFSISAILSGVGRNSKIFAWENHHYFWLKKNLFWRFLFNKCYPFLNGVITHTLREAYHYKMVKNKIIIPNFTRNNSGFYSSLNQKLILSIGWLIPRKGIDILLMTAAEILKKHPDWKWKIIGDGPMKVQVLNFIKNEKLEGRLILQTPEGPELEKEYLSTSLFVLTSRFEAFPMVLLEAKAFGIPLISFDCPSGPREIINHENDGILVENENCEELIIAINRLISNNKLRKVMGQNAQRNAEQYRPEKIYEKWQTDIFFK